MTPPRTGSLLLAVAPLAGCALEGYDPSEYLAYPALEDLAPLPGAPCAFRSVLPAAPPPASAAPRERVVGALRVESVEERSIN